jgi:uncharacterized protein GlcG (DUF336 family)
MSTKRVLLAWTCAVALGLAGCGGGGGGGGTTTPPAPPPPTTPGGGMAGVYEVPAQEALSVADVQKIIAQAVAEAKARNTPAVIAVTDRVGNVLAVYSMAGARATMKLRDGPNGNLDAQGVIAPAAGGAIAKAITGAYLSSGGNAFSSRTASMIVQQHFPPSPATQGLESGPLYGVQFSSLPCSDVNPRFNAAGGTGALIGPKRSPLGLSADPGGLPLYKNGVLVGGVGVMSDGDYGFDTNILDVDNDDEENVALAATSGFDAPVEIRADRVTVDGTTLRYSDATAATLRVSPAAAVPFASLPANTGALTPVNGYFSGAALAGQPYGTEASGVRQATAAEFSVAGGFVLTNGAGQDRFPIRAGTDAAEIQNPLTSDEVKVILEEAFKVMSRSRAQIRRPLDSRAQMSVTVVDTRGQILGIVRTPDAPIFGIDVSAQKARSVSFLSSAFAGPNLAADPSADVRAFVTKTRDFFADPTALTGRIALGNRSIGNLHRPYYPDGEIARPSGPLSRPISQFSPLSTGLQSALIIGNLAQHLGFVNGAGPDTPQRCTALPDAGAVGQNRLQNGLQVFPGGVPIYRGTTLIGGIGVSGDGIDQDDMTSFLGLANATARGIAPKNADPAIRADTVVSGQLSFARLRYVSCPFAPFLDTADQNVCQGK